MANGSFLRAVQQMWSAATGNPRARGEPEVIVHDPGAKNLDDPFLDPKAQERVAEAIVRATTGMPPAKRHD